MKRGRPTSHIKAKWITYRDNDEETYFELDDKGRIISNQQSRIAPHHSIPIPMMQPKKPEILPQVLVNLPIIEDKKPSPFPSIISPITFPIYNNNSQPQSQPILLNIMSTSHMQSNSNKISNVQQLTIL